MFSDVLKCMESPNLELKKLVYLYIINYSKSQPDLAILAVNTFRKDARERANPLIRGLAVRTMGCIGVEEILDYLCDPLRDALNVRTPALWGANSFRMKTLTYAKPQQSAWLRCTK